MNWIETTSYAVCAAAIFLLVLADRKVLLQHILSLRTEIEKGRVPFNDLMSTNVWQRFKQFAESRGELSPTNNDWAELEMAIDACAPAFLSKLRRQYSFSKIEWQVSLMVKCNFTPSEIATLTFHSREGISSIRRRLSQKVLLSNHPSPMEWDNFVLSL